MPFDYRHMAFVGPAIGQDLELDRMRQEMLAEINALPPPIEMTARDLERTETLPEMVARLCREAWNVFPPTKINAIKRLRHNERFPLGLKDAKDLIDAEWLKHDPKNARW